MCVQEKRAKKKLKDSSHGPAAVAGKVDGVNGGGTEKAETLDTGRNHTVLHP